MKHEYEAVNSTTLHLGMAQCVCTAITKVAGKSERKVFMPAIFLSDNVQLVALASLLVAAELVGMSKSNCEMYDRGGRAMHYGVSCAYLLKMTTTLIVQLFQRLLQIW